MIKYEILIGLTTNNGGRFLAKTVVTYVSKFINAFSVIEQTGYWNGIEEKSLCITILGTESDYAVQLEHMVKEMQDLFQQDSIYLCQSQIQVTDVNSTFVPRETYNSRVK